MSIVFDENLRLGHPGIDRQHQEMLEQINKLSEKLTEGADDIEVRDVLDFLYAYANKHFFEEEKLMQSCNYYGLYKQQKAHAQFKQETQDLQQMLRKKRSSLDLAHQVETSLFKYFIEHIDGLDREFADYLKMNNLQAFKITAPGAPLKP
ncbi:hemerythrin [Geomonas silvestris]|uniref:Hemerythrin n=1 Tax=Geomonas silvestris TaxID=2740184 RepID=A0A6V8MM77_9BACT|nr:hemerythrin family protein [Geomonas silvestris]GFO61034.1 hemerythrin [Geomonas silvestris]